MGHGAAYIELGLLTSCVVTRYTCSLSSSMWRSGAARRAGSDAVLDEIVEVSYRRGGRGARRDEGGGHHSAVQEEVGARSRR